MLGCSDLEACLYAEINPETLYKYQREHPEYAERKRKLKQNPVFLARKSVIKGLADRPDIGFKVLERLTKEYRDKKEVNLDVEGFEGALQALIKESKDDPTN